MIKLFIYNFRIAYEAILQNKLRSMLTSLGIICGVASVIAMLAIGKGAQQEIVKKMRLLGSNNLIIKPIIDKDKNKSDTDEDSDENADAEKVGHEEHTRFSPGLTLSDAKSIKKIIPGVENVSPEIVTRELALRNGLKNNVQVVGVTQEYFDVNKFGLAMGNSFNLKNYEYNESVCIIGANVATKLFPTDNPIGGKIKCGDQWLKVIGVVNPKDVSKANMQSLGLRNFNLDVYVPISTMLIKFKNRSLVTKSDLKRRRRGRSDEENPNYHQLDRLVVQVKSSEKTGQTSEIIDRMLLRKHNQSKDYEIIVPELLLEQERSTNRIFNIVLGAIASISLLVGGIGIMNIMLASVLERTKEIGIRRAVGAKKRDILLQFLLESVSISLTGGIIGIIVGFALAFIIESIADINTIVSWWPIVLSFFVSISVGLIFGITPARRAANQDTIELLRYE